MEPFRPVAELGKYHLVFHQIGPAGRAAPRREGGQIHKRQRAALMPLAEGPEGRVFLISRAQNQADLGHGAGDAVAENATVEVQ